MRVVEWNGGVEVDWVGDVKLDYFWCFAAPLGGGKLKLVVRWCLS